MNMKKGFWENVYYRLTDEHEVKLCILYAIRYAGIPVSDTEIKHFMLSATTVSLIDLCTNLDALLKDSFIKQVWRDDAEKYDLTRVGSETIEMFEDKILLTVREELKKSVDAFYKRAPGAPDIKCTIMPADSDNFNVQLEIKSGRKLLISLSVFAGKRDRAIAIRQAVAKRPMDIFTEINQIITRDCVTEEE